MTITWSSVCGHPLHPVDGCRLCKSAEGTHEAMNEEWRGREDEANALSFGMTFVDAAFAESAHRQHQRFDVSEIDDHFWDAIGLCHLEVDNTIARICPERSRGWDSSGVARAYFFGAPLTSTVMMVLEQHAYVEHNGKRIKVQFSAPQYTILSEWGFMGPDALTA